MPRAGWCRECGEWVWVDADDACQHGHDADCVERVYEASPSAPDGGPTEDRRPPAAPLSVETPRSQGFGDGEMPESLARFNWGAFLLPLFWGAVYGVWPVVGGWAMTLLVPPLLLSLMSAGSSEVAPNALLVAAVVGEVLAGALRLWAGFSANRMVWLREARRLELVEDAQPRFSVVRYQLRQRLWVFAGVVLLLMSLAGSAIIGLATGPAADSAREQLRLTPLDAAMSTVFLIGEIVLALWLAGKMREEGFGPDAGTGEGADGTV